MTDVVAEHRQNFLHNEWTPFNHFFNQVLNSNNVKDGDYIPDISTVMLWMNRRAADYGATVDGGTEDYGALEMVIRFYDPTAYTIWLLQWSKENEYRES